MPRIRQLLGLRDRDEAQGRNERDADYLARMVRENAHRQNFSALTFRFCYQLGLDLPTAELARMIAGYGYPETSLHRYTELELSAASVFFAAPFGGVPKTLADVARLTMVNSDTIHTVSIKLHLAQERLTAEERHEIWGNRRHAPVVQMRRT
ncbi:MAG: hypothetical protein Q9161_005697 [Pseudevernia consocians]